MSAKGIITWLAVLLLVGGAEVSAQQTRILGADELDAAVVERAGAVEQERAQLGALLQRGDVAEVAERNGIDIERVRHAAATLSAEDLRRVLPLAQGIAADLAGGQTITITTTAIIIILLIVLLIIVAS
jgi:predicted phosphoribosyltransferase